MKALATNPAGIGLLAIVAAVIMKSQPRTKRITTTLNPEIRVRANTVGLRTLFPDADQRYLLQSPRSRGDEAWCQARLDAGESDAFNELCEYYDGPSTKIRKDVPTGFDPIVDLFPLDIPGLVSKEFGQIYLSDALLAAGILAIGGQAISKVIP